MEATLPASARIETAPALALTAGPGLSSEGGVSSRSAGSKPCHVPTKKLELARKHAPRLSIPLRFMLTGLMALWTGVAILWFRPDLLTEYHYGPQIIAVTHLFAIGFVGSVVMGAVYQMLPVILGGAASSIDSANPIRLHSESAARKHYWWHLIGFSGMVLMFWIWNVKQIGHFGSIFATGVVMFAWNVRKTWKQHQVKDPAVFGMLSSVAWLVVAMLAGLYLSCAKAWPKISFLDPVAQLHGHAHLALFGAFGILLVGVTYRLLPMFLLSEVQSPRRAWTSLFLLNGGVVGLVPTMAFQSPFKLLFVAVIAAGLVCFGMEAAAIVQARKRRELDVSLRLFLVALSMFAPLTLLGVVLSWPGVAPTPLLVQLENVYGFLGLLGLLAPALQAMLLKILPFLVWYRVYGPEVGKKPTPTLAAMGSRNAQRAFAWLHMAGVLAAAAGIAMISETAVRAAWTAVVLGQACYAVNTLHVLRHLFQPQFPKA